MNLHAFYNLEQVGDCLLVRLCDERKVTDTINILNLLDMTLSV